MTLSADTNPEDDKEAAGEAKTAVATVGEHDGGIGPFLAAVNEPEANAKRSFGARLLDYSAHAAMIVGLIGFAWTVSDHVVKRPLAEPVATIRSGDAGEGLRPAADPVAELRRTNEQMAGDIKALRDEVATLSKTIGQAGATEQIGALSTSLETVKSSLKTAKNETNAALAQLSGKLDRIQHEAAADHTSRLDARSTDPTTTGSLAPAAAPAGAKPPAKLAETPRPAADDKPAKPPVVAGWVVRDVYEGVALVEGKRGAIEVVPGSGIPGAGTVKAIERQGRGWIVTTTKGTIAYAAPPAGSYRHASSRDAYRPYRYDF